MELLSLKGREVVVLIKFYENDIAVLAISYLLKIRDLVPGSLDVPLIATVIATIALYSTDSILSDRLEYFGR